MRAVVSLLLTMVALGIGAASVPVFFFWLSGFWRIVLGRDAAFFGALTAVLLCVFLVRLLLVVADRLAYLPSHEDFAPLPEQGDRWGHDWRAYTAELIGMKRWAHYRRTRQFDKLAELEAEERAARRGS